MNTSQGYENTMSHREESIESFFDQLYQVIEYQSASIQFIQGDYRIPIGYRGIGVQGFSTKLHRKVSEDRLVGKIIQSKKSIVISDTDYSEEPWEYLEETKDVKSWIGVPLIFNEQVIGLLTIDHHTTGYYTPESKEVVSAFTSQKMSGLFNTILFQIAKRLEREKVLIGLGQELTSTIQRKEEEILQSIYDKASNLMNTDNMYIALYDEGSKTIRFKLVYENSERQNVVNNKKWKPRTVDEGGRTEYIIREKRPLLFSTKDETMKWYQEHGWQPRETTDIDEPSWVGVPMISNDKVIGVIAIHHKTEKYIYNEDDKNILAAIANYAAIAIDKARSYERLKLLIEIGQRLTSEIRQREDKILESIYAQASKLPGIKENFSIGLYDEKTDTFTFKLAVVDSSPIDFEKQDGWKPRRGHKGKSEHVIHTQKYLLLNTCEEVKQWPFERHPGQEHKDDILAASWLGVPMRLGDKVLGVLATYHLEQENFYNLEDIEILQALANQAAIVIENARLYNELDTRNKKQKALINLAQELTSNIQNMDERGILQLIYQNASTLMDTANMYIALYDKPSMMIRFPLLYEDAESRTKSAYKIDEGKKGRAEEIILTGKPMLFQTKDESIAWHEQPGYQEYRGESLSSSWIGVPMKLEGKILGVVATYHPKEYAYSSDDLEILQIMANQAVIAIEKVRLYNELETQVTKRTEQLTLQNRRQKVFIDLLTQILTASIQSDENTILRFIYNNASELMDMENMYIALYDEPTETISFPLLYENAEQKIIPVRKIDREKRGRTEEIILTGESIFIQTKDASEAWYRKLGRQEFRGFVSPSWIGVPMKLGEKVLGVIATYNNEKDYVYSEDDVEILQSMGNWAAIALENARLTKQLTIQNRQQDVLIKLGQILTSSIQLTENEILQLIHQNASELMDTDNMYIAVYDELTDTIHFPFIYANAKPINLPVRGINREKKGRMEEIILTGQPIFIQTKEESDKWYGRPGYLEHAGTPSAAWIGVPMKLGEKMLGVVATYHTTEDFVYSQDDLEILQSMANWAAITLENAKLVNDLKGAQSEIADRERNLVISNLAMDFAHKMNNLTATIPPWMALLKRELREDIRKNPKITIYLDNIVRDVNVTLKEAHLLRKPAAGSENVNMEEVIDSIVGQIEMMTPESIKVSFEPETDLLPVKCVKPLISTAIQSVVQNAVKAVAEQGEIRIVLKNGSGEEKGKYLEITVSDTGCGISKDQFESIFDYGKSNWPDKMGTGYGLWRARTIIQGIGGTIKVTQSEIGKGSTFTIVLPTVETNQLGGNHS